MLPEKGNHRAHRVRADVSGSTPTSTFSFSTTIPLNSIHIPNLVPARDSRNQRYNTITTNYPTRHCNCCTRPTSCPQGGLQTGASDNRKWRGSWDFRFPSFEVKFASTEDWLALGTHFMLEFTLECVFDEQELEAKEICEGENCEASSGGALLFDPWLTKGCT